MVTTSVEVQPLSSSAGLIIAGVALVAVIGAVWAMVWGMGWFEYLGGRKKSRTAAFLNKDELKQKLLALNSPELPYRLEAGKESDLYLVWNIVAANWYGLFSKERLKETYRAFIVLDENRRSVRYYEELGRVEWSAGAQGLVPRVAYESSFFKGRILFQWSWGAGYGIKSDGTPGKVYEYKFDIRKLRDPTKQAVLESGWEYVPVVRKEHATYPKS